MEQKEKPLIRVQELRKNTIKEENHLWYDFLQTYPVQFLRQKPFGPYIVDLYCHKAKLAIELDGFRYYEGNGPKQGKIRTAYLQEVEEIRVLRFTNLEIKQNFEGVCAAIDRQVRAALPSSGPVGHLPPGEGHKGFMRAVTIYTDRACSGNPGPGGWGAIPQYGEFHKELSGGGPHTTNNRMELTGVTTTLEALKEPCEVEPYSDSKYVIDTLQEGWTKGWRARGWTKSDKKPALSPDLWEQLLALCGLHTVRLHQVKGHADNPHNDRYDGLTAAESRKYK